MAQRFAGWASAALCAGSFVLPAGAHAESGTVYCRYMLYGNQHQMCTAGPVAKAKQACEKQAQTQSGEKIECWCTDDPEYVGDFCKEHAPAK